MVRAEPVPCGRAALETRNHCTRCGDSIRHGLTACRVIEQRMARETAFRIFMARLAREIHRAVPAMAEAA